MSKRIEAVIEVEVDGHFNGQLPRSVMPGLHHAILEIEENDTALRARPPLRLPVLAFEVPVEEQMFDRGSINRGRG